MSYEALCQRLRIGGTISGSTLSGGTLLETHGRNFTTWDGLMGWPGKSGSNAKLLGRDGTQHAPAKSYRERLMTLAMVAYNEDDDGMITLDGRMEHLEDNIDLLLELLAGDNEQVIMERDLGDPAGSGMLTRWLKVEAIDPASFVRGPVFGMPHASYAVTVPVVASYPMWQSEVEHVTVVNGAAVPVINLGNARASTLVATFAGDGVLSHNTTGDAVTVAGSTGAVIVDVGRGTTLMGGLRADRRVSANRRHWIRLNKGTNLLTSTVSVSIAHRDSFLT